MKKCFVFVVIGMLATVHAQVIHETPPFSSSQTGQGFMSDKVVPRLACSAKCALKCLKRSGFFFKFCMAICGSKCIVSPTDAAYACTNNCVKNTFSSDVNDVEEFVDSCYKKCSKNL
ncbi:pollen-specific leucine-rich repeat extensin-like protein 2 [Quillaja saponaria]|uniref:Pollen-specific leucine-rich repeat extensin-like protein 2 n=1 Tax=Quillaja saponaria TaxID=32244 RepID=A0AAD7M4U4_QUISA|nr:pollen-specific leucine-rich repeat extensin-like protein 2 [Quillaja saponaria]